ncbi:hypothetical protein REPUB_Repub01dG0145700 [Reevesia pubescens]
MGNGMVKIGKVSRKLSGMFKRQYMAEFNQAQVRDPGQVRDSEGAMIGDCAVKIVVVAAEAFAAVKPWNWHTIDRNIAAHTLAKAGLLSIEDMYLVEDTIASIVNDDR